MKEVDWLQFERLGEVNGLDLYATEELGDGGQAIVIRDRILSVRSLASRK